MPAPRVAPGHPGLGQAASADSYHPGQPVWVYRGGAWRPGVVVASAMAVTVRYRPDAGRATGVDTVLAGDLAERGDPDSLLDT